MTDSQKQIAELQTEAWNVCVATVAAGSNATSCQTARLPLAPLARTTALPLSFTQQRFWFLSKLEGSSRTFSETVVMRLHGPLHSAALIRALQTIVARHEVLRTRFGETNGVPMQVIDPPESFMVRRQHAQTADQVSALVNEELYYPFDLGRDALFRVLLIEERPDSHVLVFNLHHSVTDAWSWGVLMREITTLYSAFGEGRPSPLPPLALQYADYAYWQRQWMTDEVCAAQIQYWESALAGLPPLLELPTDRPRPAVQSYRGACQSFSVSEAVTDQLVALSKQSGATLFMTLLGALDILLSRYSGRSDIPVGTPVANRAHAELEPLIGSFTNHLVMRADLSEDPTFIILLKQVREVVLNAYAHQDVPFDYLVEQVHPARSLSYAPLFQVMFALRDASPATVRLPKIEATLLPHQQPTTKFDLVLSLTQTAAALSAELEYSTDLFDRSTIERMLAHYGRLLEAIVAHPEERVSCYELLDEAERHEIVVEWNRNQQAFPQELTLHGLFESQAARSPEAIALVFEGARLSYRDLNAQANRLAHYLISQGIRPEARVGLCIERSLDMMIGILGILKVGAAYVPLDPSYPKARLDYIVADAAVECVVTQSRVRHHLSDRVKCVCLDEVRPAIARQPDEAPIVPVVPQNIAYVIYTSGSTGMPKGVMITHRNVVNLTYAQQTRLAALAGTRVLQFASFSFDGSVWEFVMAWIRNGTLVLAPKERMLPGEALTALMNQEAIDIATLPPSALTALSPQSLPGLKSLICGGEALSMNQVKPWLEGRIVMNGYGPTESTVDASIGPVSGDEPITLARAIPNITLYILDTTLQPVPIGVAGEIFIGGEGLARGYWNRPGLTAEKFLPNPFAEAGGRMYRTGDLARYLLDGKMEFLGRCDHQVKIRGFRIELGEIETTLAGHFAIAEVLVLARGEGESKHLIAYYTLKPAAGLAGPPAASDLRQFMQKTLPEHMVPGFFVNLDAFPLTPNGKIDRAALPAPEVVRASSRDYVAPRTAIEQALAGIWEQVLQVAQAGLHDNFFELGGHSLVATQVMARINDAFSLALPLRALFEAPDLESLAQRVASMQASNQIARLPLMPAARDGALPLSFAQQRLWFLGKLEGPNFTYNEIEVMRLRGSLHRDALLSALQALVSRHEILRTRFRETDGVPMQVIGPAGDFVVRQSRAETPDADSALIKDEQYYCFDLNRDALFRVLLIEQDADAHVLVFNLHHTITDGWSWGVLTRDLSALYNAFCHGQSSPLPPLALQYADFAHWQRQWLTADILAGQIEYWKRALAELPPLLELPNDRPRPSVQSYRGAHQMLQITREVTDQMMVLSQKSGATLFMALLAGFDVLLRRYSGQTDIPVGTPVANRTRPELEPLIGFFVNNLVLRADLSSDPTFTALLEQVRENALNAYANQDVPFDYLVEQLNPTRSLGYAPLFQVMFVLQNAPPGCLQLPNIEVTRLSYQQASAKFDLVLFLTQTEEGLGAELEYSSDLFERVTIQRFLDHYARLLEGIVANPDEHTSNYVLLSGAERQQVLRQWNLTQSDFPSEKCVHQLFEEQAARTPDEVAVVCGDALLTYAQLNHAANRLAHYLRESGVGPDQRVAVCAERSVELIVGTLAALKAGGAYVPLDSGYPAERLRYMLEDCAPAVLLTQPQMRGLFSGIDPALRVVELTDGAGAWQHLPGNNPDSGSAGLTSRRLAYVIYTSGSTGQPKGVMVDHRAITRLVLNNRYANFAATDRVAFASNPAFDAATLEIWAPLLHGARIVIIEQQVLLDPARFAQALKRHGVNILWLTVGLFNQCADELSTVFPRLRYLLVGGDALDPKIITRVLRSNPPQHLLNGYGPTETTTFATTYEVSDLPEDARGVPIGRAIANTQVYILDEQREPSPIGVAGELYIGGAGVARGYLNRGDLTADKFVPDPFAFTPGERMYRTGDLGRWRSDGNIEFLGRNDFQVKIRGFRIELGEIEARLMQHPAVREAAVIAQGNSAADKRLIAYFRTEADPGADSLRSHLASSLPAYMVPSTYIHLKAFPLTPNGKLNRKALPVPEAYAGASRFWEPPAGELEIGLARIWADVLQLDRIGRHDNFFDLGGHSLRAAQVVARIREQLGLEVAIRDLFASPVLSNLARRLQGAMLVELPPIQRVERSRHLLLSFAQQRLWFLAQMEGVSDAYHIPWGVQLQGELDSGALRRALNRIVARHEVLRTTFAVVEGEPVQRIAAVEESRFLLLEADLRGRDDVQEELQREVIEEASRSFDLAMGPLIRGRLLRLAEKEHALLLTMHHIVSDGWSMGIVFSELSALYNAFVQGKEDPLPELKIQYADYAMWQRQEMEGEVLRQQAGYWKTALAGAPALLELPTDHPRPPQQDLTGAYARLVLDEELTAGLRELSRRHAATLFMTLVAAGATLLARLSGQQDVVIGTPTANRSRTEIETLIGFFVNTLALRIDLSGSPTVGQLLARVKETIVAAQQHQDLPFEQVVELAHPARSLAHSPLFQVMFSWEDSDGNALHLEHLEIQPLAVEPDRVAKFDLTLSLREANGCIQAGIDYATALFGPATVERYLEYFRTVLQAMVTDDTQWISCLPMLRESERQQILQEWNRTQAEFPSSHCVHQLFESQAARTPDAVALVCTGDSLNYAQLNRRANQLAHYLRELGVGPDQRVAICMERSVEMIVALLAVLKAGGAYVPLDPTYPSERIAFVLQDSTPLALLTQTHLQARLSGLQPALPLLDLALPTADWSNRPDSNLDSQSVGLNPDHLAYVIYTSGSTGRPKGVLISHRNLGNLIQWHKHAFGLQPEQQSSSVAGFGFDAATWEIWPPLCAGATLVLPSPADSSNSEAMLGWWQKQKLDISFLPTPMAEFAFTRGISNLHLQTLLVGGDRLRRLPSTPHPFILVNNYGPTETTVVATSGRVGPGVATPSIGRAIANTQIYILDARGEPVPVGVIGELHIGGEGVARGYLNRADLTAEKFIPNPFCATPGERLYRTGDLGRWRADGEIDFVGRNDFQVKIRGFRIELGEIEATLARHSVLAQVLVVASGEGESKHLIAYYTLKAEAEAPPTSDLRQFLRKTVPEHMVPGFFVCLDAFPLTSNGKIDRAALPAPQAAQPTAEQHAAPQTPMEQTLARIWRQLLGVPRVGVRDNFFEIGGHSLLVVRLSALIKQTLDIQLPVTELYRYPTVAELAAQLTRISNNESSLRERKLSASPLVMLSAQGTGTPLVLIPGIAGVLLAYYDLAQAIGEMRPVYGMNALSAQEAVVSNTVENIARIYVSSLFDVWNEGPIHILGHSYGGMVAFEMVRQLEQMGRVVDSLILVDTHPFALQTVELPPNVFVLRYIGDLLRLDSAAIEKAEKRLEHAGIEPVAAFLHDLASGRNADRSLDRGQVYQLVCTVQSRYINSYVPTAYTPRARVLKVWAEDGTMKEAPDLDSVWRQILYKETDRLAVPGDHETLVGREYASTLGRMLNDWISKTVANS